MSPDTESRDERLLRQFGGRVRELRLQRGWSQETLAEACGLHRTYLGGIERGERNVGLLNVAAIADALGVSLSELMAMRDDCVGQLRDPQPKG